MTIAEELASFVVRASYDDLSEQAKLQLKIRILDSFGCALGALEGEPLRLLRDYLQDCSDAGHCTLIGGGRAAPDRAAFYNGALIRYLDFNDSYLAEGETCHPSDNLSAVLAAAEYGDANGKDLLTALAVSYQVHCRLSDVAPVRARGFDHTTQGSYAVAAGVSRALGLNEQQTANALAISGTAFNALRLTRTGALSHWKGLAYPNTAFGCTHAAFLAKHGITGPAEVFEGTKGFMDTIAGRFDLDWAREDLERVTHTIIKKYNAEIHSQSALEALLELKKQHAFSAPEVDHIGIDIFAVAYHIIGGGEEGDKTVVHTKEEADHSLPYMAAVALLDDQVMPEQYRKERTQRRDVQDLLRKIRVQPNTDFTKRFPREMPCRIQVSLQDGRILTGEKHDYEGFSTRPLSWENAIQKFGALSGPYVEEPLRTILIEAVHNLEAISTRDLTNLLNRIQNRMSCEGHHLGQPAY
ncbi:MAG: MmgE/PrpD family protein [Candidatus Binatia bacterium]